MMRPWFNSRFSRERPGLEKKTTRGIATPKHQVELIKQRLRWARWHHVQLAAGRPPEEG